jgi:cupin fold WbuC family metalloprotein
MFLKKKLLDDLVEPCQRVLNAIHIGSYIQPHRHSLDPKIETLIAIRGRFALIEFSNEGQLRDFVIFSAQRDDFQVDQAFGVEITPGSWHTIIAVERDSILLELKDGPFNPDMAKELAAWAPEPESSDAKHYLTELYNFCGFNELEADTK